MVEPRRQAHITEIYEGERAVRRLGQLNLRPEMLTSAATRGDQARSQVTPLHPVQSRGHRMWSDTTAALRAACIDDSNDWKVDRTNNFETIVHTRQRLALAVVGGDEFTGWRGHKDPRVRRKRGPITTLRIRDNRYLGMEPLFAISMPVDLERRRAVQTWFFLIRATDEALWLELSRPIGLDVAGYVSAWDERIILSPLPITGGVTPIPDDDDDEDDGPIVVSKK
jgi:hypothetical protein